MPENPRTPGIPGTPGTPGFKPGRPARKTRGRNPGLPHYQRVANSLIAAIQGNASVGRRVPSETAVARRFGVAKNTARRALEELHKLGYITRLRGSGSFSTGRAARTVHAFGYLLQNPNFVEMFKWFEHLLGKKGYRMIACDLGFHGEHTREVFRLDEVRRSRAVIWQVTHQPLGLQYAIAARRKLPKRMPLLCIADPLGLSLQGRHRVDLVHWDYSEAIHRILAQWIGQGLRHPVHISRTDVTLFSTSEAERAFVADLTAHGVPDPAAHVVPWDAFHPEPRRQFVEHLRALPWKPDAYMFQFDWAAEFFAMNFPADLAAPAPRAMWVFDSVTGQPGVRLDVRAMAEVCTDLLLNRMENPSRPNLRVALNIPVRRNPSQ